jgi:hypothetical protein
MHHGGRDGGAGTMGPFPNKGCSVRSGAHRVQLAGRHLCMPVRNGAWAIKSADRGQRQQGGGTWALGRSSRILLPPDDAAQGDWLRTFINGNNDSSGRASVDKNVEDHDNGTRGGGPALMMYDKDNQAGGVTRVDG